MSDSAIIRQLRERNEQLTEEVRQLRLVLIGGVERTIPGLTRKESILVMAISAGGDDGTSKNRVYTALYGTRMACDQPDEKVTSVFVCKARKKLAAMGIAIEVIWGRGWRISAEDRDRLEALISSKTEGRAAS